MFFSSSSSFFPKSCLHNNRCVEESIVVMPWSVSLSFGGTFSSDRISQSFFELARTKSH